MAIKIERIVEEDLNLGIGPVDVTMPGGGTAVGHKIGPQSFHAMAFIASMDGGQSVDAGEAAATVALDSEDLDVAGWFDPATFKFTPNVPGRYQFDAYLAISAFAGKVTVSIFVNSTLVVSTEMVRDGDSGQVTISGLVSLNGDTDYVTLRVSHDDDTAGTLTVTSARMSGFITGKYDTA